LNSYLPLARFLLAVLLFASHPLLLPAASTDASVKELLNAGRADEAIHTLQSQIARSTNDAESYNLLCRAYFMLDDWEPGIAACAHATDLDPQSSPYWLWLGRIYGEKADHAGWLTAAGLAKKVRTAFERAVLLDPKSWEARTDLAEFYLEAPGIVGGGKDKAQAQADVLRTLNPARADWVEGKIAEKNKDYASAERDYRAAVADSHSGCRAWLDVASFLRRTNRFDEMQQALRHLESCPLDHPEALLDGANMLLRTGRDYPMAVRLLHRYLSSPSEEGPAFKAHDLLGQLLEKQGDGRAAAEQYREALALAHTYARAQQDLDRVER
jgi:tetratricopeptide (TPR) repeat protein